MTSVPQIAGSALGCPRSRPIPLLGTSQAVEAAREPKRWPIGGTVLLAIGVWWIIGFVIWRIM